MAIIVAYVPFVGSGGWGGGQGVANISLIRRMGGCLDLLEHKDFQCAQCALCTMFKMLCAAHLYTHTHTLKGGFFEKRTLRTCLGGDR